MKYPEVRYLPTEHDGYLELDCWDGTCRGVLFADPGSAADALLPGRAEYDCAAVAAGLLPRGAQLVSRAGVSRTHAFGDSEEIAAAQASAAASDYITPERDAEARERRPHQVRIYETLLGTVRAH